MAVSLAPTVGAVAITTYAPTVTAGGVTVNAPEAGTYGQQHKLSNRGLTAWPMTRSLTVLNLILNVKTAVGYVPPDVTVIGFLVKSADLDTGTPALVQSLYLGDTVLVTGITTGQGGTGGMFACTPTETTAHTPVYINTTTEAATPAAGAVTVTALYYSS